MRKLPTDIQADVKTFDNNVKAQFNNELVENGLLELTSRGDVKNSYKNVYNIIKYDSLLKGLVKFNTFTFENDITRDVEQLDIQKGQSDDQAEDNILIYISTKYNINLKSDMFTKCLYSIAHKQRYNPLKTYVEQCYQEWLKDGGKDYISSMLPTYLGAETSPVTKLIAQLFLTGGIAKILEPCCKFDFVLDLVGEQGIGKTLFLQKLAVGYYTDQFTDFYDKDSYIKMLRALIINDDELTASNKSDFASVKKFVTATSLEFRKSYARNNIERPKNFIIARTTNEITYLKDKTGARRFLPIKVDSSKQLIAVKDMTKTQISLLWGQAYAIYKEHGNDFFILTREQKTMLESHRNNFVYVDETEQQIQIELDNLRANGHDFVTSRELADGVGEPNLIKNRKLASKIKYIMDNNQSYKAGSKRVNGTSHRGWRLITE